MLIKCNCESEYQDNKYGKGIRVHNKTTKGKSGSPAVYRCATCSKEKQA